MPLSDLWASPHEPDEPDEPAEFAVAVGVASLKRRLQTESARSAALLKRQEVKLRKEFHLAGKGTGTGVKQPESSEQQFQKEWYTPSWKGNAKAVHKRDRRRAVWCYLVAALRSLLDFKQDGIAHIISTHIVDDTNQKFNVLAKEKGQVITVMNSVQHMSIRYNSGECKCLRIHQPLLPMPNARADTLFAFFSSWVLYSVAGTGWAFKQMAQCIGATCSMFEGVFEATVICDDALKTNDAVFKNFRRLVATQGGDKRHIALQLKCCIHQYSLIRRPICLAFDGYWTMLVRLAHLFEAHSFRVKFSNHLAKIVAESFNYVSVVQLPALADTWRETRRAKLKTLSGGKSGRRIKSLMEIEMMDNGDTSCSAINHWCTGCCTNGPDALKRTVGKYVKHFGSGYAVPLLYRWKHAEEAQLFLQDDASISV
jgi:hypothetical protein